MRGLLLALVLICGAPAWAAPHFGAAGGWGQAPGVQRTAEGRMSVEQAARIAQRAVGGRVLAAEPAVLGGRDVVRVKLLTRDGVVRVVIVDAATGRVF